MLQSRHPGRPCRAAAAIIAAALLGSPLASAAQVQSLSFKDVASEVRALELIRGDKDLTQTWQAEDAAWLFQKGWWEAARELVNAAHEAAGSDAGRERQQNIDKLIRREVTTLKKNADDLLLKLSTQDSSKIGVIRCASQWAQNSTAIFLSVKFAHRWSSPGALQVHDEKISTAACCFNFSAEGEHSQLRKKYNLDFHFFDEVDPEHWHWQFTSAGRMSVEIRKKEAAYWPRLLNAKEKPGSLGVWDSMDQKWLQELKPFKRKHRGADEEEDRSEEEEKETHRDLAAKCIIGKDSPWRGERTPRYLCDKYWPPKIEGSMGKKSTWMVLFISSRDMTCKTRGEQCMKVKKQFNTVSEKLPDMVKGVRMGVVDCDDYKDFCEKQNVGHLPFVRRYKEGKRKAYRGEWDIPSLSQFAAEA